MARPAYANCPSQPAIARPMRARAAVRINPVPSPDMKTLARRRARHLALSGVLIGVRTGAGGVVAAHLELVGHATCDRCSQRAVGGGDNLCPGACRARLAPQ